MSAQRNNDAKIQLLGTFSLDYSRKQKSGLSLARIAITMQASKPCQTSPLKS
jgi:hypothetical protein